MKGVDLIVLAIYSLIGVVAVAKEVYACLNTFDVDNQMAIMDSLSHRESFLLNTVISRNSYDSF